jgi:hypothetical protein
MVRPERFELPTLWFEAKCSIQLSYGRALQVSKITDYAVVGKWAAIRRLLPALAQAPEA